MLAFLAGSVVSGAAPGFELLLIGRLMQAAGAGIIMPLLMNVVLAIYPPDKRGGTMGLIGVAIIFAPAIGPAYAGYMLDHYVWRSVFYVIIPLAALVILLAFFYLKNVTERAYPKLDIAGMLLSTVGFGTLLYGCSRAGAIGWTTTEVIVTLLIGIAITIVTTIGFTSLTDSTSYSYLLLMSTGRRIGMGMFMMPITTAGLNQLPAAFHAHGTAISNTVKQVSGAIGTALLVTILTNRAQFHAVRMAAEGVVSDPSQLLQKASIAGMNDAYVAVIIFGAIGLVMSFFIKKTKQPEVTLHGLCLPDTY